MFKFNATILIYLQRWYFYYLKLYKHQTRIIRNKHLLAPMSNIKLSNKLCQKIDNINCEGFDYLTLVLSED
jgi:hypothetical protein